MNEFSRLEEGMPVRDISGVPLGRVGCVAQDCFELCLGDGNSYWINPDALYQVGYGVVLVCNRGQLLSYRVR